jgi:hypothetical protein
MGRQGLVTHGHYDNTYNWFLQVEGSKTFYLVPPSSADAGAIHMYPVIHPYYGHISGIEHVFPPALLATPEVVEATLRPGDLLYIPPMWIHHVVSETDSVSVNIFTYSAEYDLYDAISKAPIPFEADWSIEHMQAASARYLKSIITRVLEVLDETATPAAVVHFVQVWLIDARYSELVARGDLKTPPQATITQLCEVLNKEDFEDEVTAKFDEYAHSLARSFGEIFAVAKPQQRSTAATDRAAGVVKMLLGNFMEHLISGLLGTEAVLPFLECFTQKHHHNIVHVEL